MNGRFDGRVVIGRVVIALMATVCTLILSIVSVRAQTVSAPASQVIVAAGDDWATRAFQDPIDMNEHTDISWWPFSVDQPAANLSGVTYGECTTVGTSTAPGTKCFKATTATTGANLWILETGNPHTVQLGKTGDTYPIPASTYKTVAMRMRFDSVPGGSPRCGAGSWTNPDCNSSFLWTDGSLYDAPQVLTQTRAINGSDGWQILLVDLTASGYAPSSSSTWTGNVGSLRYNLPIIAGSTVEVDWIRIVPNTLPSQTITWSGFSGNVDIYLDGDTSRSNGHLGLIVKNGFDTTLAAVNQSGGSYSFQPGALPPGEYWAYICPTGANPVGNSSCKYSPGSYLANAAPTLTFTSPSPEGSADDFATVQLNNPWDMDSLTDLDYVVNVTGLAPTTISAENEAGLSLGSVNVLRGTAVPGTGDPYMYLLWYAGDGRGRYKKIDSDRYHILTLEMGLPNLARDINNGSIGRVVWQRQGEPGCENVSNDIIINHRAGTDVLARVIADMKTLRLEDDPGASPCTSGWNGNIESFRWDPHEFIGATPFDVRRVKLAAKERTTAGQYTIRWAYSDALHAPSPTLTLSYDTDKNAGNGFAGPIATGIDPASANSYAWNALAVPSGTYYIHASVSDGLNTNSSYAEWPIIVDATSNGDLSNKPRMVLSRSRLNFGGTANGASLTPAQQVNVELIGTGGSSVQWQATPSDPRVIVSPTIGTGNGTFSVSIQTSNAYPNNLQGDWSITVQEVTSGETANAPQTARVFLQMYGTGGPSPSAPFGSFDTPLNGITGVQGSIAVTGWALDDKVVQRVEIWRDLVPGETTVPYGGSGPANGKVYIADALFVDGARTDIEAAYPTHPFQYRAGWGYLLLTWGLWQQGNGPYTLHAFAVDDDGNTTTLGSKTISVNNAAANKPFGALDTPSYGQTVSGGFWNYGWALTPNPGATSCVITNGNVYVGIDSGPLVPVNYGDMRADIAASFPGFTNGTNSGGAYYIDSTTLSNGTHQIGWYVVDSCGRADGVGSRFFNVFNAGAGLVTESDASPGMAAVAASLALATSSVEAVAVRRSLGDWESVVAASGVSVVDVREQERFELQLPSANSAYAGGHLIGGDIRPLPAGSSLDAETGRFYWEPAPGFLGRFDLRFVADQAAVPVRVVVGPPLRMLIDTPAPGVIAGQPFVVAGWALDMTAAVGTGIDAIHVWAHPADGGQPVFLGIAVQGGAQPDVAAVYGEEFARSGYNLVAKPLPPGTYDVVVYARRAATDRFDGAQVVRVMVP